MNGLAEVLPVLILNWNHAARTCACVARLRRWAHRHVEIVVIDNASDAEDRALLQHARADQILWNTQNLGFAGAHQGALDMLAQKALHNHALLLNADASLSEQHALALLKLARSDASIAVAGPVLIEGEERHAGGWDITTAVNTHRVQHTDGVMMVDHVPGTVALISLAAWRRVGAFDSRYFFGGEMADWCRRATRIGLRCLVHGACTARHQPESRSPALQQARLHYTLRNRWLFAQTHGGRARWLRQHVWLIAKRVLRGDQVRARVMMSALWCGLRGDFGNHNARFGLP